VFQSIALALVKQSRLGVCGRDSSSHGRQEAEKMNTGKDQGKI
jgi:hypothetical protein